MRRKSVALGAVAVTLLFYVWAAVWVFNANVRIDIPLPPWAMVALPPVLYATVVLFASPWRRLTVFALFCSTHALLGLGTAALYAQIGSLPYDIAAAVAFWAFPPAPLLAVICTLILVVPLGSRLEPRARWRRRRGRRQLAPTKRGAPAPPGMPRRWPIVNACVPAWLPIGAPVVSSMISPLAPAPPCASTNPM
jgi:hypothetical protein